jgi:membrane protein
MAQESTTRDEASQAPKGGWMGVLKRTKRGIGRDHVTIVAGGVAFFGLLAIIPALAALISLYGLLSDPEQIRTQFVTLRNVVPQEAYEILNKQMENIIASARTAGFGAALGLLLALWGGAKGMKALIEGLNIMYHEEEKRGFVKLNLTALLLTVLGVVGIAVAVGLVAVLPALLNSLGLGESTKLIVSLVRWPLLLVLFMLGLGVVYRFGPSHHQARWKWLSWGAVAATALWLAASGLFSLYVANFGSYNKTYGSLGAIVILLMWFYITAYVVLLGAELNTELEEETAGARQGHTTMPSAGVAHSRPTRWGKATIAGGRASP